MKKLTVENVNALIEECTDVNKSGNLVVPKTMTYPEDVFLDYRKLVEKKEEIEDLMRQTLPFFSANKEIDFPANFFGLTGESNGNGGYVSWANNSDDISRLLVLGLYARILDRPKEGTLQTSKGATRVLTHHILNHLKPALVNAESKR